MSDAKNTTAGNTCVASTKPTDGDPPGVVSPGLSASGPNRKRAPSFPALSTAMTASLIQMRAVRVHGSQNTTAPRTSIRPPAVSTVRQGTGRLKPPAAQATNASATRPAREPRLSQLMVRSIS